MQAQFGKYQNQEVAKLSVALARLFANISLDNFNASEFSGTTNSVANTSSTFRHGLDSIPSMILILEGNAYVAFDGVGVSTADIRSTGTSQPFRAVAIK
jgi:hypothetical protein